jgi:hypothetical protein
MKLLNQDTTVNIVGFDLPALDNWMIRVSIEFDLLNPQVLPSFRDNILSTLKMYYPETGKFYEEMKENKSLKKQSGPLVTIRDALANARNAFNNNFEVLKVKSLTHAANGINADWGGFSNIRHNILANKYQTIKALRAAAPDELSHVVLGYVKDPKYSPTSPPSIDNVIDGQLMPIPIPELNLIDNPNLQWGSAIVKIKRMHDQLDPNMVLHNLLVDAKSLADLPKEYQEAKYQSALGKGIFPAYLSVKFPEPDNELRVVEWRAGLKLVGDEDTIPSSKVPEMLVKENEDETAITALFSRARTKKQKLFYKASLMQYIVASEYLLPEENVIVTTPLEMLDGTKQTKFYMNIAFRPNHRVVGLREKEVEHNENYVKKKLPPLFDKYFDSTTQQSHLTYKLEPDFLDPKGKLMRKVAIEIPPHGIDMFDMVLDNREKMHNKRIDSGLPGIFKDDQGIIVKVKLDFKESLRSIFDQNYAEDFRFEEIILGFFLPLVDLSIEYFTDPLTRNFFWKYMTHSWRLDKERLQSLIAIIQTKPANSFATKKMHNILTSAFYRGANSDFKEKDLRSVQPIINTVVSRAPQLGIDILRTFMKNDEMLAELENTKPSKSFMQQNYNKVANNVPRLVVEYKNMINVYPYAEITNTPDVDAGWYYTKPQTESTLNAIGLETEEMELVEDRKSLEFGLFFLETAMRLLADDMNRVSTERRYFVKVSAEEEEEEEEEGEEEGEGEEKKPKKKKPKKKAAPIIKGKTASSLRNLVVRVQKSENIGNELRDFAVEKGLFKDWGQTDMLDNKADPIKFLIDVSTELAAAPDFKDKDNVQGLPAWLKQNLKNYVISLQPYDLLYVFELPNPSIANYLALFLRLYYDPEIIHVDVKVSTKPETWELHIWKSIASILSEKMSAHYKDDLALMEKEYEGIVSDKVSDFINSLLSINFSNRDNPGKLIPEILKEMITSAKKSTQEEAIKTIIGDEAIKRTIKKIIAKIEPKAEIIDISIDEMTILIHVKRSLSSKSEAAIAEEISKFAAYLIKFKYDISGLEGKLEI